MKQKIQLIEQSIEFTKACLLQGLCTQDAFEHAMKQLQTELKKAKEDYERTTN